MGIRSLENVEDAVIVEPENVTAPEASSADVHNFSVRAPLDPTEYVVAASGSQSPPSATLHRAVRVVDPLAVVRNCRYSPSALPTLQVWLENAIIAARLYCVPETSAPNTMNPSRWSAAVGRLPWWALMPPPLIEDTVPVYFNCSRFTEALFSTSSFALILLVDFPIQTAPVER